MTYFDYREHQRGSFTFNQIFATVAILFVLFAFVRANGGISEILFPSQTKAEVVEINKQLNKDLTEVIQINKDNIEANKAISEAKEFEQEVLKETEVKKEEIKQVVEKKQTTIKKKVAEVNKKATANELTPEEVSRAIVKLAADSIWDDYCADYPSDNQCLKA